MIDSEGRITTYHSSCNYYDPNKDKPIEVKNTILGKLYECNNFSPKNNLQDYWQEEVDNGKKYCHTCVRYGMLSETDIKKFLRDNGWETWYNEDNWIKTSWHDIPGMKIDMAGMSTMDAYKSQLNEPNLVMKVKDENGNIHGTK